MILFCCYYYFFLMEERKAEKSKQNEKKTLKNSKFWTKLKDVWLDKDSVQKIVEKNCIFWNISLEMLNTFIRCEVSGILKIFAN